MNSNLPFLPGQSDHPTRVTAAQRLAQLLAEHQQMLVLAESCTGGQVAAQLTEVPGISQWWCGSLVTYRNASKREWLGISPELMERHTAVSREVTTAMIENALRVTPEATVSAAVTGHLGPHAPANQDGEIHTAVLRRGQSPQLVTHQLPPGTRLERLHLATLCLLEHIIEHFETS